MREIETLGELHSKYFNEEVTEIRPIRGDGSDRRIFRIFGTQNVSIGIDGENIAENRAFLGFTKTFASMGLAVPEIYAVSDEGRCYIEEDLGDTLLFDWQIQKRTDDNFPSEVLNMYESVLRELVRFQIDSAEKIDYSLCYQYDTFAEASMMFDLQYFMEMFIEQFRPESLDSRAFEADCRSLVDYLLKADCRFFLYRDFQSRNIMIKNGVPRFIDYQSGRRGALQYDVASMLYDAKARIPEAVRDELLTAYISEAGTRINIDKDGFSELYYGYAIIRVLQALGAFGNLGLRKRKPGFLSSIPPALENLEILRKKAPIMIQLPSLSSLFARLADDHALRSITEPIPQGIL